jgi:hypothetical protein
MHFLNRFVLLAGCLVALVAFSAGADDVSNTQKKVAQTHLTTAGVKNGATVESESLIFCSSLPEVRAKTIVEGLQKVYKTGRKGLQFEQKEEAWKGKLAVFFLPTKQEYNEFLRLVAGERPGTAYALMIRSDEPYVVGGGEIGEKAKDADISAELGTVIGAALLMSKAGSSTPVPGWVRTGFGRAAVLRAEGMNGRRFLAYRAEARAAVLGGKGKPALIADVWEAERADSDLLATSLMDYMAFGPGSANFSRFLTGLKPNENGDAPTIQAALESGGWKPDALEAAWKKWVQAGIPEAKQPPPK